MAEENRTNDYVPVLFGEYNFGSPGPRPGQWALTLGHDLVLTGDSEDTVGHILKAGETIYLPLGSFQQSCIVGAVATAYPAEYDEPGHPVNDLAERVTQDRAWTREYPPTLPELPF